MCRARAILPYKIIYWGRHLFGANVAAVGVIWALGDVALSIVIWPNLIALLLAPVVVKETKSYFERRPWEAHAKKAGGGD